MYFGQSIKLQKALDKLIDKITFSNLKKAIKKHRKVTEKQIVLLEEVFKEIGTVTEGKKCEAIVGVLKEVDTIISKTVSSAVSDASVIEA